MRCPGCRPGTAPWSPAWSWAWSSVLWHIPKFLTAGSAQDYSFWIFLIDNLAKAIIYTWVFNSTRGSLLTVTLLHAALNTSAVFLPILPAVTGDERALMISVGLHCLVAIVIVIVALERPG